MLGKATGIAFRDTDKERLIPEIKELLSEKELSLLLSHADAYDFERLGKQPAFQKIVNLVTTPETFFFRDREQLDIIQNQILPQVVKKLRHTQDEITIWSAGCSSGEEVYSLAYLAYKKLEPELWKRLKIIGTDINPQVIQKATNAIYQDWSFRGVASDEKHQLCREVSGGWQVVEKYRERTWFSVKNLNDSNALRLMLNRQKPSIIICRNVFIYLEPRVRQQVMDIFRELIHENGFLIMGHSEAQDLKKSRWSENHLKLSSVFSPVDSDKTAQSAKTNSIFPTKKLKPIESTRVVSKPRKQNHVPRSAKVNKSLAANNNRTNHENRSLKPVEEDLNWLHKAYEMANQGQVNEANNLLDKLLDRNKLNADAYYLKAMLSNDIEISSKYLQKSIYLDENHLMSNLEMGSLLESKGEIKKSKAYFQNVHNILNNADSNSDNLFVSSDELKRIYSLIEDKIRE